jgi:type 1 glutamine amidotransferase
MKKALIAWGGWEGHEPRQGAERVAAILDEEGFQVTTVEGSEAFADPALSGSAAAGCAGCERADGDGAAD